MHSFGTLGIWCDSVGNADCRGGFDSAGVWFWTKPRVRVYMLVVTGVVVGSTGVTVLVLAGLIPDSRALRIVLSGGLVLVLATLLTRISVDVIRATAVLPESAESSTEAPDAVGDSKELGQ